MQTSPGMLQREQNMMMGPGGFSGSNGQLSPMSQQQQPQFAQPQNTAFMNNYASDYFNNVRENRSIHGNHIDNSLALDPAKEKKSMYNVIYETDAYNPWGKPGGGAPRLDNSGQLRTKKEGTLWWNLNGETEDNRNKRLANSNKSRNTLLYKKDPTLLGSPRSGQDTTYNYNYRDPQNIPTNNFLSNSVSSSSQQNFSENYNNQSNASMNYQQPPMMQQEMQTHLEREANMRNLNRSNTLGYTKNSGSSSELNRVSNKLYNDNQPTVDYPNHSYWFGRAGTQNKIINGSAPIVVYGDARRKNLLDALENRSPRANGQYPYQQQQQQSNTNYTFVNSPESNHRNNYENQLKMQM